MAAYIKKFGGFIADVANIDFKRCDGTVYSCDTATATNMTPSANSISVTGGQGQYPIGFIDTDRGLECGFTNAKFDADMFEIASATTAEDVAASTFETKKYSVETGLKIELDFEVVPETVYIRGLKYSSSDASTGSFKVEVSGESSPKKTVITFYTGDVAVNDEVYVSYERKIANAHNIAVKTNTASAKGEVWMHWPIYSEGTDCTEAAIKGYVHVHVFRVRVTALPAIDSSYKTAATHAMTFTAIDPKRADGKMYEVTYEEL